jgi:hypothetical protein
MQGGGSGQRRGRRVNRSETGGGENEGEAEAANKERRPKRNEK